MTTFKLLKVQQQQQQQQNPGYFVAFVWNIPKESKWECNWLYLRQNTNQILAIVANYRKVVREAKPFIIMLNGEDPNKKGRKKV